jgi:CubicO group peptidase (beta-lactamase class C family)
MSRLFACILAGALLAACVHHPAPDRPPRLRGEALDHRVQSLMQAAQVPGLALAVIEDGQIVELHAYGERDTQRHLPLRTDTVMYAASLTKAAFAYSAMMLADENRLDLDRPIAQDLPKPLPDYPKYADLAGDPRWRELTPRILLSHRSGFANFRYFPPGKPYDPQGKLQIYFEPGSRYAYSGEGIDVGEYLRARLFERFGMRRTAMTWRDDFEDNHAIGYDEQGRALGHKRRESVRAAGSMDTTLEDFAQLAAAMVRGEGLSPAAYASWLQPQIRIRSVQQFPTMGLPDSADNDGIGLAYALGVGVYQSPQGPAWFKEGHDDGTNNLLLCLRDSRDCLLVLSNSSRAESLFPYLIQAVLGPACFPWYWASYIPYDHPQWSQPGSSAQPHDPCMRFDAGTGGPA